MEKHTFQLEIGFDRWLWSGFRHDYHNGHSQKIHAFTSPVGKDGWDDPFLVRKPDFDVFGVPRRTRKQRGWYHVQRHPKSRPEQHASILPASKLSSDALATGADVPIELFRLVGQRMGGALSWRRDDDKHTMMACALVCRYWASLFLSRIFEAIAICSRKRAIELCKLENSPQCYFRRIRQPFVEVRIRSLSELSWVHLLASRHKYVHLTGPLPPRWKTIRSVHQALPQSLPRSFSSNITWLTLTDIHFQRFMDLVHLVCELPDLDHLRCEKVTWGLLPETITLPRRPRTKNRVHLWIEMESGGWAHAEVHILAYFVSRSGSPFLPSGATLALSSLVTHMRSPAPGMPRRNTRAANPDVAWWEVDSSWDDRQFVFKCTLHRVIKAVRIRATLCTTLGGDDMVLDVRYLGVTLCPDSGPVWWKTFDWREFDKQITLLRPTQLVFKFESMVDMLAFRDEVVHAFMPLLSARGSIRYAVKVFGGIPVRYRDSRDSGILQGPLRDDPQEDHTD